MKTEVKQAETKISPDKLSEEEFRRRYIEQKKRLACPGCGDDGIIY